MLTSTLERWCKLFLSLVSSTLARPLTSQLKEKGLKIQQLQMQESELSDWNGASVCTNPLMDYWLNWTEGVPDSFSYISQFFLTLISLSIYCTVWGGATWSYCVLRRFSLQCKPLLTLCPLSVSSPCKVSHSEGQGKACWVMDFAAWVTTIVSPSHLGLCSFTVSEQEFRPTISSCLTDHIVVKRSQGSWLAILHQNSNSENECRPWKSTGGQSEHEP